MVTTYPLVMADPFTMSLQEQRANPLQPGSLYYAPAGSTRPELMSQEFEADWSDGDGTAIRDALNVVLPNGRHWCIDRPFEHHSSGGPGWTVTGDAPNITVTPDLVIHKLRFKGRITDGQLIVEEYEEESVDEGLVGRAAVVRRDTETAIRQAQVRRGPSDAVRGTGQAKTRAEKPGRTKGNG